MYGKLFLEIDLLCLFLYFQIKLSFPHWQVWMPLIKQMLQNVDEPKQQPAN